MRTRSGARVTACLAACVLLLASGCTGGAANPAGAGRAPRDPVTAADRGAEFRIALPFGLNSLDPHRPVSTADSIWMRPLYDSLLTLADGPDGVEPAPQLATSYEIAQDGMSVTFELREDVAFQDGTRFDADAVAANMRRARGPDSTVASLLASLDRVEVIDPSRVVFHLSRPDPGLPWSLADSSAGMMISPAALDSDLRARPAGSGPYTLVSAAKDGDVVYRRWDRHWDSDAALAAEQTISIVLDANARYNAVRSGRLDAAFFQGPPHDSMSKSLEAEGFHWEQALSPISYGVFLNTGLAPFDDVRVRRAVGLAVNRPAVSHALRKINPPSYQPFNKGYLGFSPNLDANPHDPEAARALVRAAGAEGASVTLAQYTTPPFDLIAEIVQQSLTDIGLKVELFPLSPTEGLPNWRKGATQAQVGSLLAFADPSRTLTGTYLGEDAPGPADPVLEKMAEDARALPAGSAERERAYQRISAYLVENPVHVPIAQFSTVILARPDVVGSGALVVQDIGKLDLRGVGVTKE
ncbi:ABC transporter substrate-binding protein [Actinomadura sp. LOL_016]|uniref:ABC transporter substrate-binding protein n=1 Tax=unclassified Actinomadura TaxID=2626254 RepID=UPI003A7FA2A2